MIYRRLINALHIGEYKHVYGPVPAMQTLYLQVLAGAQFWVIANALPVFEYRDFRTGKIQIAR